VAQEIPAYYAGNQNAEIGPCVGKLAFGSSEIFSKLFALEAKEAKVRLSRLGFRPQPWNSASELIIKKHHESPRVTTHCFGHYSKFSK
jgi:hypothetical protein